MGVTRVPNKVVRQYKRRTIQSMKFTKLTGILQMEFYRDASQKHRSIMGQVGTIQKKDTERTATVHWQSKTIGRLHKNVSEAVAYAARLTREECGY